MEKIQIELKSIIKMLRYCIWISWKSSPIYMVLRILINIVQPIETLVLIYINKEIINLLTYGILLSDDHTEHISQFIRLLLITVILVFIKNGLEKVKTYCTGIHNTVVSNYIEMSIAEKAVHADMSYFDSPDFSNAFENAKADGMAVTQILWLIFDLIANLVIIVSTIGILWSYNFWLALIPMLLIIPSAISEQFYTQNLYNWDRKHIKDERKMSYLQGIMSNPQYAEDIRINNMGSMLYSRHQNMWKSWFVKRKKLLKNRTIVSGVLLLLPDISEYGLKLFMGVNVILSNLLIGDYIYYSDILAQLGNNLFQLITYFTSINEFRMRTVNLQSFLSLKNEMSYEGTKKVTGDISIEFVDVSFKYPGTENYTLNHISFKLDYKEKTAIVGTNGAGKTTIIKLILRFYDVTRGKILINGINITEYDIVSLRSSFSVMFQQYMIYAFTVEENLAIAGENIEDIRTDKIDEALIKGEAKEFVEKLPQGSKTYINRIFDEGGVELSGGQRQRVALARAFYRDSSFVILDEPSAALDPEAEYHIFNRLEKLAEKKGAIITSHRLSNIASVDKILLIENGTVLENGTHQELLAFNGRYAQLYNYQASKYMS